MNIRGAVHVLAAKVYVFFSRVRRKLDGTEAKIKTAMDNGDQAEAVRLIFKDIDMGVLGNISIALVATRNICDALNRSTNTSLMWAILGCLARSEVVPKEYQWVLDDYYKSLPPWSERLAIGHWVLRTMIKLGEVQQHQVDFYLGTGEALDAFLVKPPEESAT